MQEWLERSPSFALEPKNISGLESLVLLVKCLKIMENATFLSNDNQVSGSIPLLVLYFKPSIFVSTF